MSGYTRQSSSDLVPTAVVRSSPLNTEYNKIRDAFAFDATGTTGHKHDGSSDEGSYVPLIADLDALNKVAIDTGNNRVGFFVEVSAAAVEQVRLEDGVVYPVTDSDVDLGTTSLRFKVIYADDLTLTNNATIGGTLGVTGATTLGTATITSADINGGTLDGAQIGAASPSTVVGTVVTANTGFVGDVTGDVVGNVTGNVTGTITGNITGNVTGDITSSGSSTFNNVTISGTLDMDTGSSATVTGLPNPTLGSDAANKTYVDTSISDLVASAPGALDTLNELAAALGDDADFSTTVTNSIATKLPLAGGTMSGAIAMGTNKITGLDTPTAGTDATNKTYVDAQRDTRLALAGGTMTGNIVLGANKATSTATPTTDDDLTRKGYVDGILGSATAAATSAGDAATSETNAATSATDAQTAETNAQAAETGAEAARDLAQGYSNTAAVEAANAASAVSYQDLAGLNETLGITAVGAYIYDTSLDKDGGAWRYNCGHTSWEREDRTTGVFYRDVTNLSAAQAAGAVAGDYYLPSSGNFTELTDGGGTVSTYRAGSQRFPAVALITIEADRIIIWDMSDATMWWALRSSSTSNEVGVFRLLVSYAPLDITATMGVIGFVTNIGSANNNNGWHFLDFAGDKAGKRSGTTGSSGDVRPLVRYYDTAITTGNSQILVSTLVNCITSTVLPNAPLNTETGLPLVTTVVGTGGGLTILNGPKVAGGPPVEGNAVDITYTGGTGIISQVAFREDGALVYAGDNTINGVWVHVRYSLPTSSLAEGSIVNQGTSDETYNANPAQSPSLDLGTAQTTKGLAGNAIARASQMNFILPNRATPTDGSQVIMKEDSISPVMSGSTLGAWMASTDTNSISGTDLVTNGTFDTDTTGWTAANNATLTAPSGVLRVAYNGTSNAYANQILSGLTIGGVYKITVDITAVSGGTTRVDLDQIIDGSGNVIAETASPASGEFYFVATTTTPSIALYAMGTTTYAEFDNISVQRVDADVSPNEKHLDVTGTLTRTAVATGSDLVGYSGFSVSNYVELPNIENYLTGFDDFTVSMWIKDPGSFDTLADSRTAGNDGFVFLANAGVLRLTTTEGASTTSVNGSISISSGWKMVTGTVSNTGATLTTYVGGSFDATVTSTARDLSSMAGALRFGLNKSNANIMYASAALASLHDTALTAEQIATKYNIERFWFEPNAVISLDSSVVRTVAYDKALKNYHVLTDTGHSVYDGRTFVRLEYTAGDWDWITVDDGKVAKG